MKWKCNYISVEDVLAIYLYYSTSECGVNVADWIRFQFIKSRTDRKTKFSLGLFARKLAKTIHLLWRNPNLQVSLSLS